MRIAHESRQNDGHHASNCKVPAHAASQPELALVVELAGLLSELQELLQSYAPTWYAKSTDDRIRNGLASVDRAFAAAASRQ
jgi:hypothetical protein